MRRNVTVPALTLVGTVLVIYLAGLLTGFMVGKASADTCSGWSGQFFNYSSCGGTTCQGVSFGPFWTQNCDTTPAYTAPVIPPPSGVVP